MEILEVDELRQSFKREKRGFNAGREFHSLDSWVISLPKVTLFILIVFVRPQLWQRDTSSSDAAQCCPSGPVGQCHPSELRAGQGTSVEA